MLNPPSTRAGFLPDDVPHPPLYAVAEHEITLPELIPPLLTEKLVVPFIITSFFGFTNTFALFSVLEYSCPSLYITSYVTCFSPFIPADLTTL